MRAHCDALTNEKAAAMTHSRRPGSRLMRWLQRGEQAAPAPRQPDPADMGTCFGLDMAFDDAPVDPFARTPARPKSHPAGPAGPSGGPGFNRTVPGAI